MNFWIFQATPEVFNLRDALKHDGVQTFSVRSHKQKIQKGDKVILWLTGKMTGCYALAEVTSEVQKLDFGVRELPYIVDQLHIPREAVQLNIEYNLWNNPIFKEELPPHIIKDLKVNIPGTNFEATSAQYQAFLEVLKMRNAVEEPLIDYKKNYRVHHPKNLILFGAPGTGKTYHLVNYALSIIEDTPLKELEQEPRKNLQRRFQNYKKEGQVAMITFHQSFAYEDFVEGIKPQTTSAQDVIYEIQDGVLKRMVKLAAKEINQYRRFVLLIDEINRGNIAAIFGELITLIEENKRAGQAEAISVQLPYSKEPFSIPKNLYIIGTMNTADRSTESLDNALRRRFAFVEQLPQPHLLPTIGQVDLNRMLTRMNKRIRILLDEDYVIGHAYLLHAKNIEDLQVIFKQQIIPLLQEYFYNDWSKIGMILGKVFVKKTYILSAQNLFADFDEDARIDYEGKAFYQLTPSSNWDEMAFKGIYEG